MEITVYRYNSKKEFTHGLLFIDGKFECHTLEDEYRAYKVWGETRIPDGKYHVKLRLEGRFHNRYKRKFPYHEGMLHVTNVPNFKYILIHIGNTTKDTAGCLLVGSNANAYAGVIEQSTVAYGEMYKKVIEAFKRGEEVSINYVSEFKF